MMTTLRHGYCNYSLREIKLSNREFKYLAQCHTASKEDSLVWNPSSLASMYILTMLYS
jgi:hypothetical protein